MKIFPILNLASFFISAVSYSQNTVTGTFTDMSDQQVKLTGFEGFNTYTIDSVRVNAKGNFTLSFDRNDYGMGYLVAEDNKPFIVILAPDEYLSLEGEALALPEKIIIKSGKQNQLFEQYTKVHPRREQVLSAWDFLSRIYRSDSLFTSHEPPKKTIESEKHRINEEDRLFLEKLNPDSYVSWYLPLRKLVSSVSIIAQYRTEEIPAAITAFRNIDYTDLRLYKSGLLRETIDAHFWLIENSGRSLDSVFIAPDFAFNGDYFAPGYEPGNFPRKLSDLKSKYILVIFGASWCPHCPEELSRIISLYEKWKKYGVEVVFVSLDEDKQVFKNFAGIFPFISMCDYKKWDSPPAKEWHVFAMPAFYLLNDNREILLRPASVQQMDAWVEWYIIQGNECKQLEKYLGMTQAEADKTEFRGTDEGGKLKEAGTAHWTTPNTGATNLSEFTALPGGFRSMVGGNFVARGLESYFWTSTSKTDIEAWERGMRYDLSIIDWYGSPKYNGFYLRCIKD